MATLSKSDSVHNFPKIICWQPTDPASPMVAAAERLYEQTLDADERIPWAWIQRSIEQRAPQPTGWHKHLLLAAPADKIDDPAALAGYAFGAFLPGYGGYLSYLGVAESARRMGVGSRLMEAGAKMLAVDAALVGESLPFVIWESYRPSADEPEAAHQLWNARVRTFARVGGLWVDGVTCLTPNYADPDGPAVPLQLFVKPVDLLASHFQSEQLLGVVGGLLERVYRQKPGSPLYDGTFTPTTRLRLRPARAAGLPLSLV